MGISSESSILVLAFAVVGSACILSQKLTELTKESRKSTEESRQQHHELKKSIQYICGFLPGKGVDYWTLEMNSIVRVTPKREDNFRESVARYYECYRSEPGLTASIVSYATCCVTGHEGTGQGRDGVVVSHNLGRARCREAYESFCLDAVVHCDNFRNMVLLTKQLETWYEEKRWCFFPTDDHKPTFYMKIMDPDIRKTHVHSKPLRVYESNLITFPDNKAPFTRIFSHHAQCCYANAINKGWILPKEPPPPHFGSPLKDDTLQCQPLVPTG